MSNEIKHSKYQYLSTQEQRVLKTPSNIKGFLGFAWTWFVIMACFVWVAYWPNPVSILITLLILGGRQLALGILLHDCSHRSWFKTQKLNDFFGHWLAGIPVLVPMSFYRDYHFTHHVKTGAQQDPDVNNIRNYPVSRASMRRKLLRDFLGLSGLKNLFALLAYVNTGIPGNAVSMGVQQKHVSLKKIIRTTLVNYSHILLFHGLVFSFLFYIGHPALYLLWWAAFIFTYPFIIRVRQIGEHGAMPMLISTDVRDNTRTTIATWWERLLFSPHYVNSHCEHHYMPTVPGYHLSKMHALMKARGFYQGKETALASGYFDVLQRAMKC